MNFLHALVSFVLRAVMLLAGLVFAASLLIAGLVLGLVVVVWSLLRGRRPTGLRWYMSHRRRGASAAQGAAGDVVDVQAREVHEPTRRLPSDN